MRCIPATASSASARTSRGPAREAGLRFIGPTPEQLALFGDKARARALATQCDVPVMPGSAGAVTLAEAQAFFAAQQADGAGVMVKAIGGGGGRGMRAVLNAADLPGAHARCMSEAKAAFGVEGVYVERLMRNARHIEVQVIGDGDAVASLGERECTLQRRFQKLVEIAPSPSLSAALRERITQAALAHGAGGGLPGAGHLRVPGRRAVERIFPSSSSKPIRGCRSSTR